MVSQVGEGEYVMETALKEGKDFHRGMGDCPQFLVHPGSGAGKHSNKRNEVDFLCERCMVGGTGQKEWP